MLQSQYEHLYDHITTLNIADAKRLPFGTVIPEKYYFIRKDSDGTEHFDIYCTHQWFQYHTSRSGSETLYTTDNRPSVFRKPPAPYLSYKEAPCTRSYRRLDNNRNISKM